MDVRLHTIPARDIEAAAFAPYGQLVRPRRGGQQFTRNPYDPATNPDEAQLVLDSGQPRFYVMDLRNRGLVFRNMARHRRVTQCFASLQGKDWYMAFAPPGDFADATRPDLDDVVAFRIPGDCLFKLHVGTWHAGPQFTHEQCLFVNLEMMDTNHHDFQDVPLPCDCVIAPVGN